MGFLERVQFKMVMSDLFCPFILFLENVSEQLKGQGTNVQEGHQAILNDLAEVRGRAQEIYSKMGNSYYCNTFSYFSCIFVLGNDVL